MPSEVEHKQLAMQLEEYSGLGQSLCLGLREWDLGFRVLGCYRL